jgi:flagellar motor switch protein FliN/FliY
MSDFLSQDDIDALLGLTSDDASPTINKGEIATNILNMYIEHVKSVANTNLGRPVNVEINYVDTVNTAVIIEKIGAKYLLIDAPYSGGCNGNMRCIISKDSVGIMSDYMIGGDGTAPYSDDCKDAMTEFFGQISGAFATELGAKMGSSVSADSSAIMDSAGGEVLDGDITAFCYISIDGSEPIIVLISPDDMLIEALAPKEVPQSSGSSGSSNSSSSAQAFGGGGMAAMGTGGAPINIFSSKAPKINVDMLLDVELEVTIELGKTNIAIKKVLDLAPGALVELDRFAGEPVDLLVNNKVVAKGEVVVIDENFGVRIISLVSPEERIRSLK